MMNTMMTPHKPSRKKAVRLLKDIKLFKPLITPIAYSEHSMLLKSNVINRCAFDIIEIYQGNHNAENHQHTKWYFSKSSNWLNIRCTTLEGKELVNKGIDLTGFINAFQPFDLYIINNKCLSQEEYFLFCTNTLVQNVEGLRLLA